MNGDSNRFISKTLIAIIFTFALLSVITVPVFAEDELEDEIQQFVTNETGQLVDKLTEDIDFGKENFLNTNEQETDALKDAGKNVFNDLIDLAFSSKTMAKAGIEFLSPFELNAILVTVISILIAIFFALSMVKAIGKHIAIMVILGLIVVGIFVWLRINS